MYKSFTEMPVWQKAHFLSIEVFIITKDLPRSEDYGLTSQIRRSANSVSANIAEGFGRKSLKEKAQFYSIAKGSAYETQNHLLYGNGVRYFEQKKIESLILEYEELIKSLNKIIKSFEK